MDVLVSFMPTKILLTEILSKDIDIHDCILDLLDNAVDSYVTNQIVNRREIKLNVNKEEFTIYDNCGGISIDLLKDTAFRTGAKPSVRNYPTIGMYGIGLKRSIFKLGKSILFETDDGKNHSKLEIDIDKWLKKPNDWNIDLSKLEKSTLKKGKRPYTLIRIKELYPETIDAFTTSFNNKFKENLQIYYTHFIEKHITIYYNNEKQKYYPIKIKTPIGYSPASFKEKYRGVEIRIICWIEQSSIKRPSKYEGQRGWNVFMNNRLIILNNTNENTGWIGKKPYLPKFHPIYNEFRGIVYMTTNYADRLPLNTSKNNFDKENFIYNYLLIKMCEIARPLIDHLNRKYKKSKLAIKEKENQLKTELEKRSGRSKIYEIEEIKANLKFKAPRLIVKSEINLSTITYKKTTKQIDKIKKLYKLNSNSDVGSFTFDKFLEYEGLNDD